jgi:hypothetical protein
LIVGNTITFTGSDAQIAGVAVLTLVGAVLGVVLELILVTGKRYGSGKD